ncbi:ECF transporter S component [Mycoplasmopsis agalactiae]|nr:ECF transporter S component [Mycoplasmopsis agalactiae]MCE6090600.1 ECF transporter S component [Mycoplasmopsis agalactiae]
MNKILNTIKKKWHDFSFFPRLTIRKISFVGILIAISVVIFVVFASFVPLISIPTYKISFIGLPIKISGLIFGPLVGGTVGLISDIISFSMFPTFYNFYYTLAAIVDGVIAGLVGIIFLKILNYAFGGQFRDASFDNAIFKQKERLYKLVLEDPQSPKISKIKTKIIMLGEQRKSANVTNQEKKLLNINLLAALLLIVLAILFIYFVVFRVIDDSTIKQFSVIPNKIGLYSLMTSGYLAMFIFLIVARFKMHPKRFLVIIPIVIFSAIIELINVPLLSLADYSTTGASSQAGSIITYMFQHIVFSPIKIWFNMFVIFFTYNVINPLVNKNSAIMYE